MSMKTGLFFSLTFCCVITPSSGIIVTVLWKIIKNLEKTRTNQEQYTLRIMKILGTGSLGSNFTGSYNKKSAMQII